MVLRPCLYTTHDGHCRADNITIDPRLVTDDSCKARFDGYDSISCKTRQGGTHASIPPISCSSFGNVTLELRTLQEVVRTSGS